MGERDLADRRSRWWLSSGICLVAASCLALAGCANGGPLGRSSSRSTVPVVATAAPDGASYTCPGIPDEAVEAMFGPDSTIVNHFNHIPPWCIVKIPGRDASVLYIQAWYIYRNKDPWDEPNLSRGQFGSDFSFPGIEGTGKAWIDEEVEDDDGSGDQAYGVRYGSTVFICGDHYLALSIDHAPAMQGDLKGNLVNLTQSALPWLCQDQPIPGLDQTMEDIRPPYAHDTPQPSTTPTDTPDPEHDN
ncbi:hypothetical protein ACSL103130_01025 [Actinomyces slackii]|uniref:DUF3558 domain-containing protein n=1 Tax=Actinomyces slackii TaxID=52774 RepID=A0A448KAY1_9ACTO|nr:Uncharacterised protein [Actinomyces slackii]